MTRTAFLGAHPGRWAKIQGAIDAFPEVNANSYTGVIAVYNDDATDSGAAGNGVLCNPWDTNVTFLAHETGHVFGLQHSFDNSTRKDASWSAPGEYFDKHDLMSAMNVYTDNTSPFVMAGPLLATPNQDRMGWLDQARVWAPSSFNSSITDQIDLVSLGHPDVAGFLAAKIGSLYVEFRTVDGWDSGIPRPGVLIHYLHEPNAVVLASDPVAYVNDWQPGQTYGPNPLHEAIFHGGTRVHIDSFNVQATTARITISHEARPISVLGRDVLEGAVRILSGVKEDGGGWIILPSGRIVRVPPRSPILEVLDKLAVAAETESLTSAARRAVESAVFEDVADLTGRLKDTDLESQGGGQ
jgi:hypothetical protein